MRKVLDTVYLVSGWLAAAFIAAIGILVVAQVSLNLIDRVSTLVRGTAVGMTIPSYADFTGFFLAAASFLALAHTLREGGHIRVTILIGHLPARLAAALEFWCVAAACAVACYFTWYTGVLVLESYTYNDLSSGMIAVPLWIPQSTMLVGLAILSLALIDIFIGLLLGRKPGYLDTGEGLLVREEISSEPSPAETEKRCD